MLDGARAAARHAPRPRSAKQRPCGASWQAKPAADPTLPDLQQLREDHAALTAYIASAARLVGRDAGSKQLELAARVAALEHELAASAKRLAAAEAFAARESSRAVALRAELVDYARRVDALERELRLARAAG